MIFRYHIYAPKLLQYRHILNLNTRQISLVGQLRSAQIPALSTAPYTFPNIKKKQKKNRKPYLIPAPKTGKTNCITNTALIRTIWGSPDEATQKKINAP